MEYIAFRETKCILKVPWRQHLAMQNDIFDVRGKLRDGINHSITERFPLGVVPTAVEVVGGVLDEA